MHFRFILFILLLGAEFDAKDVKLYLKSKNVIQVAGKWTRIGNKHQKFDFGRCLNDDNDDMTMII